MPYVERYSEREAPSIKCCIVYTCFAASTSPCPAPAPAHSKRTTPPPLAAYTAGVYGWEVLLAAANNEKKYWTTLPNAQWTHEASLSKDEVANLFAANADPTFHSCEAVDLADEGADRLDIGSNHPSCYSQYSSRSIRKPPPLPSHKFPNHFLCPPLGHGRFRPSVCDAPITVLTARTVITGRNGGTLRRAPAVDRAAEDEPIEIRLSDDDDDVAIRSSNPALRIEHLSEQESSPGTPEPIVLSDDEMEPGQQVDNLSSSPAAPEPITLSDDDMEPARPIENQDSSPAAPAPIALSDDDMEPAPMIENLDSSPEAPVAIILSDDEMDVAPSMENLCDTRSSPGVPVPIMLSDDENDTAPPMDNQETSSGLPAPVMLSDNEVDGVPPIIYFSDTERSPGEPVAIALSDDENDPDTLPDSDVESSPAAPAPIALSDDLMEPTPNEPRTHAGSSSAQNPAPVMAFDNELAASSPTSAQSEPSSTFLSRGVRFSVDHLPESIWESSDEE
ncbi:hypothetical protein BDN70DRAFT_939179 [Pholiota conissans]|uniref:Uncharacterized protein n=1 Tax=Pholiota conissans TaxID=109636 RepID=A0A9P5YJS6_9AGAR|nr:hypothetical protein BDN70DRAFT_939179 [Pholiota conissans]